MNVMQHNCISFCKCKCICTYMLHECCDSDTVYNLMFILVILAFLCVFMDYVYMYIPSKESPF